MGVLLGLVEKGFNIKLPSSTKARKIGATCTARHLGARENALLSTQMSHNQQVHSEYYAAVRGCTQAAEASNTLEELRKGPKHR